MENTETTTPTVKLHDNATQAHRDMNPVQRRPYDSLDPRACTAIDMLPDVFQLSQPSQPSQPYLDFTDDDIDNMSDDGSNVCACCKLGRALVRESTKKVRLAGDLVGHMFGHLVSTKLSRAILTALILDGTVQIFEGTVRHNQPLMEAPVDPLSEEEVGHIVKQAYEAASAHDCIRLGTEDVTPEEPSLQTTEDKTRKGNVYLFKWRSFPEEGYGEHEMVSFFNEITNRAIAIAESQVKTAKLKLRHRFAAAKDKDHAIPLASGLDSEIMRPDFFLLPIEAFSDEGLKTVDERYINFTALRLVGALGSRVPASGRFERMRQYARGLKCAQPWVHSVLGMTISQATMDLSRGDCSGWEHLTLALWDGRGSIEFIRLLLGLALADAVDLGQNPDVELGAEVHTCKLSELPRQYFLPSDAWSVTSSQVDNTSAAPSQNTPTNPRSGEKRHYSQVAKDSNDEEPRQKKCKTVETNLKGRFAFSPKAIYGYRCLGTIWTPTSHNGRETAAFVVEDPEDSNKRLVLKMWWESFKKEAANNLVMERLEKSERHANVILPLKTFKAERHGKTCTTIGVLRGFLEDVVTSVPNRVLTVSTFELKRPVKYFWGVHDFVRGLRGALLGHAYLTEIGVLHRDISENNMVLGLYPWEERGYLIDFDLAILQEAEKPSTPLPELDFGGSDDLELLYDPSYYRRPSEPKCLDGIHGTFPYVSINVLNGRKHTHFDDVESFFYVLFLFFLSYAGPLAKETLQEAHVQGFVALPEAENLPHTRKLRGSYRAWKDARAKWMSRSKRNAMSCPSKSVESDEFVECLEKHWPRELHNSILDLLKKSHTLFHESIEEDHKGGRSEVSHESFITVLDKWLEEYGELEQAFSNCPFEMSGS